MAAARVLTVWCPDWPLVAAEVAPDVPAAVVVAEEVLACTAAARADGVRRGLRRREAQRRCPELLLLEREPVAEMRVFEPVVAALETVCPRVEVVRPGLCLFATKGPSRYFGGDANLADVAMGAVQDLVPDAHVGVADGRFASELAARELAFVPPGGSAAFLAPYAVEVLDRPELADLLRRLGVRTLGEVAALPAKKVTARFGTDGTRVHRLCRGLDEHPVSARVPPPDLAVVEHVDPPAETVEPLVFQAKRLADAFTAELAERGLACTRVLVEVETENGELRSRLWRYDGTFTSTAVAQRVRWQLDGWLTSSDRPSAGVVLLRLVPDEVHRDTGRQLSLFGGPTDNDERAAAALARVQGLLGFDAVQVAVAAGGRDVAGYARLVPWGEPRPAPYDGSPPWPGRLPAPYPSLVHPDPLPAQVLDEAGAPVQVGVRGTVTASPRSLAVSGERPLDVTAWAGPWLVDERWWDAPARRREALLQVVTADGTARLLAVSGGQWSVTGTYD